MHYSYVWGPGVARFKLPPPPPLNYEFDLEKLPSSPTLARPSLGACVACALRSWTARNVRGVHRLQAHYRQTPVFTGLHGRLVCVDSVFDFVFQFILLRTQKHTFVEEIIGHGVVQFNRATEDHQRQMDEVCFFILNIIIVQNANPRSNRIMRTSCN